MKTAFPLSQIIAMMAFLSMPANAGGQTNMHAALDALRRAESTNSVDDLQTAKMRLSQAKPNKGGYRVKAIANIEQAVAKMNAGRYAEADKWIAQAINFVEKGIVAGLK